MENLNRLMLIKINGWLVNSLPLMKREQCDKYQEDIKEATCEGVEEKDQTERSSETI